MDERWMPVKGFEGSYEISDHGRLRSLDRVTRNKLGRLFSVRGVMKKTHINNSGYECADLSLDDVKKKVTVHRLVALHFCENRLGQGAEVNHIDGNRLNNRADNLEWVTRKENVRDTVERGTHNVDKAHEAAWEVNKRPVVMLTLDGVELRRFPSMKDAAEATGTHASKISLVCSGKRRSTNGYFWRIGDEIV